MGTPNTRIDLNGHPEAATIMKIDGRASAPAGADNDRFRRLTAQGFDILEING
ncbi:hypothetical protein [Micromonospora sp. NPDC023888]|uniref:hypothetical protein n=1 Tax=Micromonospora sp. NPDC023888 TaxID=3155607 RepID=UPI0033C009ED